MGGACDLAILPPTPAFLFSFLTTLRFDKELHFENAGVGGKTAGTMCT